MRRHNRLDARGLDCLECAKDELRFIASSLADLGGIDFIRPDDILGAIQFRSLDRRLFE